MSRDRDTFLGANCDLSAVPTVAARTTIAALATLTAIATVALFDYTVIWTIIDMSSLTALTSRSTLTTKTACATISTHGDDPDSRHNAMDHHQVAAALVSCVPFCSRRPRMTRITIAAFPRKNTMKEVIVPFRTVLAFPASSGCLLWLDGYS
jgi:hypothetical protein